MPSLRSWEKLERKAFHGRAQQLCLVSRVSLERSQVQAQNEQTHYFTLVDGVQFKLNSGQKIQGIAMLPFMSPASAPPPLCISVLPCEFLPQPERACVCSKTSVYLWAHPPGPRPPTSDHTSEEK